MIIYIYIWFVGWWTGWGTIQRWRSAPAVLHRPHWQIWRQEGDEVGEGGRGISTTSSGSTRYPQLTASLEQIFQQGIEPHETRPKQTSIGKTGRMGTFAILPVSRHILPGCVELWQKPGVKVSFAKLHRIQILLRQNPMLRSSMYCTRLWMANRQIMGLIFVQGLFHDCKLQGFCCIRFVDVHLHCEEVMLFLIWCFNFCELTYIIIHTCTLKHQTWGGMTGPQKTHTEKTFWAGIWEPADIHIILYDNTQRTHELSFRESILIPSSTDTPTHSGSWLGVVFLFVSGKLWGLRYLDDIYVYIFMQIFMQDGLGSY